ncbi:MAG: PEP-CTERM sorting domain-containing protein [Planctomycetota bacterium]
MRFTAFLVWALVALPASAATYSLTPYVFGDGLLPPAFAPTLSGFVTTDGTLGQIDASNIVSYEFSLSGPFGMTLDSSNSTLSTDGGPGIFSGLIATASALVQGPQFDPGVPAVSTGSFTVERLAALGPPASLSYSLIPPGGLSGPTAGEVVFGVGNGLLLANEVFVPSVDPFTGIPSPPTVASNTVSIGFVSATSVGVVPEPTSVAMLAIGVLGLAGRTVRRKSART